MALLLRIFLFLEKMYSHLYFYVAGVDILFPSYYQRDNLDMGSQGLTLEGHKSGDYEQAISSLGVRVRG